MQIIIAVSGKKTPLIAVRIQKTSNRLFTLLKTIPQGTQHKQLLKKLSEFFEELNSCDNSLTLEYVEQYEAHEAHNMVQVEVNRTRWQQTGIVLDDDLETELRWVIKDWIWSNIGSYYTSRYKGFIGFQQIQVIFTDELTRLVV